ncbi:hypothetical protein EZV62_020013 [Acer yangbiense]|uniref:Retroviral polymerase SH3-like domain-containing protein n=1 Tax=Acer yangbiense TaxID=1000413 RepID=A0A5C7HCW7_9ROSI|nr:hypothetical protein EZV62_020013 [Acer yangbiense]
MLRGPKVGLSNSKTEKNKAFDQVSHVDSKSGAKDNGMGRFGNGTPAAVQASGSDLDVRLYNLKSKKIVVSRDVIFDEQASFDWEKGIIQKRVVMIDEMQDNQVQDNANDEGVLQSPHSSTPSSLRDSSGSSFSSSPSSTP